MNIACTNELCKKVFKLDIIDLEKELSGSGTHTTQYLASGTIYCPACNRETEIQYLYDEVNDTGEILDDEVISLH